MNTVPLSFSASYNSLLPYCNARDDMHKADRAFSVAEASGVADPLLNQLLLARDATYFAFHAMQKPAAYVA